MINMLSILIHILLLVCRQWDLLNDFHIKLLNVSSLDMFHWLDVFNSLHMLDHLIINFIDWVFYDDWVFNEYWLRSELLMMKVGSNWSA